MRFWNHIVCQILHPLDEKYGSPQTLPDAPERCRLAVNFILLLAGVRGWHS